MTTTGTIGNGARWAAAGAGAFVCMAAVLFATQLLRLPVVVPPVVGAASLKRVELDLNADAAGRDERVIHDQMALFLPTDRNVGVKPLARPVAGASLLDQEVKKLSFGENELALRLPPPVSIPEKPVEAILTDAAPTPLYGFGRATPAITPVASRGAVVEVWTASTNQRVLAETLPETVRPPGGKPWRPMEFLADVRPAGLWGALILTERSDTEEAENYFRVYLARTFRIGERLPPGAYRVIVGP